MTPSEASDAGVASIEHVAESLLEGAVHDPARPATTMAEALAANQGPRGEALFARFVHNGTWVTPTLVGYRAFADAATSERGRTRRYRVLDALVAITGAMHRAGVKLLAGSDLSDGDGGIRPGEDLHEELELLVRAGLTPTESLWTATTGPALFLGRDRVAGGLHPGMRADLVILGTDPRLDIRATRDVRTIILAGRVVPPEPAR